MPHPHTRIIDAWNGWYHINGNTYGTWIRGDPRGWRARHHREHVDGDYKHPPPPDAHQHERELSRRLMSAPVHLSPQARELACHALIASLKHQQLEVIACSVDDHHYHILARFRLPTPTTPTTTNTTPPTPDPAEQKPTGSNPWDPDHTRHQPIYGFIRHTVGLAKSRAARALSEANLQPEGGSWAKRFKITPITDRAHQLTAFNYILDHGPRGAATWSIRTSSAPTASSR